MTFPLDHIIFAPNEIDLARSPLAGKLDAETYILGAFNPGMTRLPNGNLLLMVRVAEALRTPIVDGKVHAIRWAEDGYRLDPWPLQLVDTADPRKFLMRGGGECGGDEEAFHGIHSCGVVSDQRGSGMMG